MALEDASTTKKGVVQLSSATNSTSETLAATPKAVKSAYDNAEKRLQKDQNGADIPDNLISLICFSLLLSNSSSSVAATSPRIWANTRLPLPFPT
ncbi:phage tail fiber repeat family protein [Escherichia coli UMNF18]|nr:phage tail fiber repeat family protein [Escherichia coli UMNF18]EII46357.1 phage tail fiber repeat protein [Escherichia coli 2.3916]